MRLYDFESQLLASLMQSNIDLVRFNQHLHAEVVEDRGSERAIVFGQVVNMVDTIRWHFVSLQDELRFVLVEAGVDPGVDPVIVDPYDYDDAGRVDFSTLDLTTPAGAVEGLTRVALELAPIYDVLVERMHIGFDYHDPVDAVLSQCLLIYHNAIHHFNKLACELSVV